MVRDSIVHKSDSSVDNILTEICERETSLMMKDQVSGIIGDSTGTTRYSRRASHSTPGTTSSRSGGTGGTTLFPTNWKWMIPKFPDTWRSAFGNPIFRLLLEWRTDTHKGKTQMQLSDSFSTLVESVKTGASNSSKN